MFWCFWFLAHGVCCLGFLLFSKLCFGVYYTELFTLKKLSAVEYPTIQTLRSVCFASGGYCACVCVYRVGGSAISSSVCVSHH